MLDDPPPKFGMVQVYNHITRSEVETPIISVLNVVIQPFDHLFFVFKLLSSIALSIFESISGPAKKKKTADFIIKESS